jgi:hypothetical protein
MDKVKYEPRFAGKRVLTTNTDLPEENGERLSISKNKLSKISLGQGRVQQKALIR